MLPQTTLIALKPRTWLRNSKTQFRSSWKSCFLISLLSVPFCSFTPLCSNGSCWITKKNFNPGNKRQIQLYKVSQGSYCPYSSCKGSAVIRFIHTWQAEVTMSREQGWLRVPLLLFPHLCQACALCPVMAITFTSCDTDTHRHRHCTNTMGAAVPALEGPVPWGCLNGYDRTCRGKVQRGEPACPK